MFFTLGIETSCDDTSVALVDEKGLVLDSRRWTRDLDHIPFGGIVPERASRNHLELLTPMIDKLLKDHDLNMKNLKGIAVTNRPGLLGSLIVGLVTAKTLSMSWKLPFLGVNHLEGHIYSAWLAEKESEAEEIAFPHLSLIVSGGHTHLVLVEEIGQYRLLGRTKDDAIGEALDKFSNLLGLGFPGGPKVDKMSQKGDPKSFDFPRPMLHENNYDFSFSGLKAAGLRKVEEIKKSSPDLTENMIQNLCSSYLSAGVDVLVSKTKKAIEEFKPKAFSVVGGVSANSLLRSKMEKLSQDLDLRLLLPSLKFCTDNAAMIAYAGSLRMGKGEQSDFDLKPSARSLPDDFVSDSVR